MIETEPDRGRNFQRTWNGEMLDGGSGGFEAPFGTFNHRVVYVDVIASLDDGDLRQIDTGG